MANTLSAPGYRNVAAALLAFAATLLGAASRAAAQDAAPRCPTHVPAAVDPPAGLTLERGLRASGVQIYECSAEKASAPSWVLRGPHALLTAGDAVVGIHYAGPAWQGLDGSSVTGGAKRGSADAPVPNAVPWLSLSGTPTGDGTFGRVTFIQRLETAGGTAPSSACTRTNLGQKVLAPYTSSYFFYRPAGAGEVVRQCRSAAAKR